jgi:NodT family efflux transporter outer membrane factor (OMF) lipoprotein
MTCFRFTTGRRSRGVRPLLLLLCVACTVAHGEGSSSAPTRPVDRSESSRGKSPSQWYAPLPHNGRVADLTAWWAQFDDALLDELIAAAQRVSPSIADASARIAQARAARVASGAALAPSVDSSAYATRGRQDVNAALTTRGVNEISATWELDLFGANRAARDASAARLDAAHADWHAARVAVAAETALVYVQLRASEALTQEASIDATSRAETLRLTEITSRSGFESSANEALARASASQAQGDLKAQRTSTERLVKSLVALTDIDEPTLRSRLAASAGRIPRPLEFAVDAFPATALAQRPDVYSASREVAAASADERRSAAARYPRISLAGSFGHVDVDSGAAETSGTLWTVGPVQISLPIFDGGRRRADLQAARAAYDASVTRYQARVRTAVKEVEDVLVRLHGAAERAPDVERAAQNFAVSQSAAEARFQSGLGSLFDLEDARREAVQARKALIALEQERVSAWIDLYRALGGGWASAQDGALAHAHE